MADAEHRGGDQRARAFAVGGAASVMATVLQMRRSSPSTTSSARPSGERGPRGSRSSPGAWSRWGAWDEAVGRRRVGGHDDCSSCELLPSAATTLRRPPLSRAPRYGRRGPGRAGPESPPCPPRAPPGRPHEAAQHEVEEAARGGEPVLEEDTGEEGAQHPVGHFRRNADRRQEAGRCAVGASSMRRIGRRRLRAPPPPPWPLGDRTDGGAEQLRRVSGAPERVLEAVQPTVGEHPDPRAKR